MRKFVSLFVLAAVMVAGAQGFASTTQYGNVVAMKAMKPMMKNSLYDRLGGLMAIRAVVDAFVARVAGDKRINKFFAKTAADPKRLARFKGNLVDQICMATGGPCKYKGKDMKTAHAGMGIATADFNALVQDLSLTLDKFKVGATEKKELLGALAPMKSQIVEK